MSEKIVTARSEVLGFIEQLPNSTSWIDWNPAQKQSRWIHCSREQAIFHLRENFVRAQARRAASRPRDSQRSKLYSAELLAFKDYPVHTGRSLEQARALAKVYAEQLGFTLPRILEKRGARSHYRPRTQTVALSRAYGLTYDWVLTHELCHFWDNPRGTDKPWHGPEFAACHVRVVECVLGRSWADRLRAAYKLYHVKCGVRKRRTITEEQRASLRERLVKARAAKGRKAS